MRFFNREKEIKEILSIIESEPQRINFIYGSINSGKTALINEIINNRLDKDKYVVFYFDLREIFISRYDDFIEVLFEEYEGDKNPTEIIKSLINELPSLYGIPIPKNTLNEIFKKKTTKNVFRYITKVLMDIKKEGKQPILIIDELQKIGDMKINGFLIYELFNYFVSLTKHKHLCHVFCLSSDSLFIERVYNEAMLKGRVDYILVDDFDKETAIKFIDFLSENILNKKLSDDEKELIYTHVGGKPVDIIYVIDKLRYKELKEILDYLLMDEQQKLKYFLEDVKEKDEELYKKVVETLKIFKENYEIDDITINKKIREFLVKRNILFLNPIEGTLKPQSFLVWNAIKKIIQ
ncbi:ATP-binding protein [Methanocaldococcus fervens]|uniref:ATPase n=1 Tax=Methanocaldococcus fervens (strain DSM 4213 / JCM 15782 / AG86) TaxID=573064 RepID=C7P849_METFA|nr:ATP-binding protein [Methanocaldococcus fervens]ACV24731.1 ATPase [Methanocaldococcus fervens AG86]